VLSSGKTGIEVNDWGWIAGVKATSRPRAKRKGVQKMCIAVSLCKRLKRNSVDRWGMDGTGNGIVDRGDQTSEMARDP
jgi:hypothetical protein